jgi:SAM-dependent methyltransferase
MTPSLASAFGGPVYGVEPSERVREQAIAHASHTGVSYADGSAEDIPLPDASCDAALLFFVWHHVGDHEGAARELRRVVKPGGKLFLAGNLFDRMPDIWWFRVVPEWFEVDRARFPSEEDVRSDLVNAGWTPVSRSEVTSLRSADLAEDLEKLRLRANSNFELMNEDLIAAGFARIEAVLPSLRDGPKYESTTLLVFQR